MHFGYLYRSSHSFFRKAWLHFELLYNVYTSLFAWFALVCHRPLGGADDLDADASFCSQANWYIAFQILTGSLGDDSFNLPWAKCEAITTLALAATAE